MSSPSTPASPPPDLRALARSYDVATDYHDWQGRPVDVPEQTITRVLAAMGVDVSDPSAALRARTQRRWRRMLPASVVVRAGQDRRVWMHVDHGAPADLVVELEDGGHQRLRQLDHWVEPQEVDGRLVGEATFALPTDLPLGYHTLRARSGDAEDTATLIVTPAWLGLPDRLGQGRAWGLAAQLYSVRSRRSWGVGDLADLTDLAVWSAARLGADYLLVNPLHAAEPTPPMEPSPYLPTSRRFFNPLYLRVERIPEYVDLPAAAPACGRPSTPPTRSTATPRGRRSERCSDWSTPSRAAPAASSTWTRSGAVRAAPCTTSRPGARSPRSTAPTTGAGPRSCATRGPAR